ncbi:phosphoglycolate phosphatase 1A, chloroplastic-like isoform X2 [Malania oleifera]|uniref:phosphoglycolate phosphatase 1A, chloroplastic-like isoform X2 n=1 Tax=Malania oleifera TaxID=397392 RepID=UPI0025AE7378|nr:phosphoglycolate phosphatase 1A, chloroplastic-like isoform X2 [Malania oleifera]
MISSGRVASLASPSLFLAHASSHSRFLGLKKLSFSASSSAASLAWFASSSSPPPATRMARNFTTRASAQPLKNADELIDSVKTFIFDCDGVIWKGDSLIDGVPETLDMLRSKGKRLVFVTNNSTKSRKQYGKKFETLGLNVIEEEIFASSFAAAAYLQSINFPKDKKEHGEKKIELKPGFLMEHDNSVGAVVVGFDRYFNYYKVQYGTLCIRENPGCLFIATNRDAVTHLTDAQEWAGGGSMVGAICGSTQRDPLVVGKPSTFMMDYLADKFNILKSQICMVGDRLDTDILFGQNGGCKTLLVLSGVTTLSMLQNPKNTIQPDFYTSKISDFLSLKTATV